MPRDYYSAVYPQRGSTVKLPEEQLDLIVPKLRNCQNINPQLGVTDELWQEVYGSRQLEKTIGHETYCLDIITHRTPLVARRATQIIAHYFRRELDFDIVQYEFNEERTPKDRIFLWTKSECGSRLAVGAICFRWRTYMVRRKETGDLRLAWLWLHPYLRRKGFLSSYWNYFRDLYGNFIVESPLSRDMEAFLRKKNECPACGRGPCKHKASQPK